MKDANIDVGKGMLNIGFPMTKEQTEDLNKMREELKPDEEIIMQFKISK